jgi:phosphoglycerate dehydrogenase-like enzyme
MKILVGLPVNDRHKKWLEEKAQGQELVYVPTATVTADMLQDVDIIIGNVKAELLQHAPKLKWLQLNSAGADAYCKSGVLRQGTQLTNATGAYGLALSEHMLAALMAMQKKLYLYYDHQKQAEWKDAGPVTSIDGSTVLILGMGDIGGKFARKVKALGAAHVIGIRRRKAAKPDYVDEIATMDELDTCLARADVVAASLPGTAATYQLMDAKKFACMKQGSYFVNIGRGTAVVTDALCDAVSDGHLAGAAVDVTDPEPLPADHRMWKIPGIYITPHISGQYHLAATLDNIVHIAANNIEAFLKGDPLKNVVDFTTGYKK